MEVLRRMSPDGRVTAPHVATLPAEPQMDPRLTDLQALFTSVGMRFDVSDGVEMTTFGVAHALSLLRPLAYMIRNRSRISR
jgi:hypothetical protein